MYRLKKIKWAYKLLRSKYFVVLTDKESAIAMEGIDPKEFTDFLALRAQQAAVGEFITSLKKLSKRHEKIAEYLLDGGMKGSTDVPNRGKAKARKAKQSR